MDIWSTLARAAEVYPEKIAVVDGDRRFTYAEVLRRAGALGSFLRERGLDAGDRIGILEVNTHAYLEAYYAAAGIGAILVPLNIRLSPRELGAILRDAGARWLLAGGGFGFLVRDVLRTDTPLEGVVWTEAPQTAGGRSRVLLEDAVGEHAGAFSPAEVGIDDVAHLYYTSGTTGRPKGVMLTHGNVCTHAVAAIEELDLTEAEVWAHFSPMFHLADAWATFAISWVGGRHVMSRRFDAPDALGVIERERVTLSNLIPSMLGLMTEWQRLQPRETGSLRALLSGGAPIAPTLVRAVMEAFGCDYIQTYGMTETSPYLTLSILKPHLRDLPPEEQFAYKAKTGRPFAAIELRVVAEDGSEVAADSEQVGEICVRGPTVTPGYWRRPEETRAAFEDGWLRTGDLATLDAEGYVDIVDRKKDMIITGGENVYSIEVENILIEHPDVLEAAVFGVPDARWGEAVTAAVVLRADRETSEDEIIAFCKRHLAAYKTPKTVDFLPELPRTGSGKITKAALRERYR